MKNKLYILTDKTLDPIYSAVQGGHAVANWLLEHYNIMNNGDIYWEWNNDYLIYLSVDIDEWFKKLLKFDPDYSAWTYFREPDLNNKLTSIAVWEGGLHYYLKNILKDEQTLKVA